MKAAIALICMAIAFGSTSTVSAAISISNSGSVTSTSRASASTGGNTAEGGVVITGDAAASATSETHVGDGTGYVETRVETVTDGVVQSETKKTDVVPGKPITVIAATSSQTGGVVIERGSSVTPEATSSSSISALTAAETAAADAVEQTESFVRRLARSIWSAVSRLAFWR